MAEAELEVTNSWLGLSHSLDVSNKFRRNAAAFCWGHSVWSARQWLHCHIYVLNPSCVAPASLCCNVPLFWLNAGLLSGKNIRQEHNGRRHCREALVLLPDTVFSKTGNKELSASEVFPLGSLGDTTCNIFLHFWQEGGKRKGCFDAKNRGRLQRIKSADRMVWETYSIFLSPVDITNMIAQMYWFGL